MTKKTFTLIAIASCAWIASSSAATIPAGTTLAVQTIDLISSRSVVGRTFTAKLDQDIAVNGKVVLRAGTKVLGKIEASRANPRNSKPLTVNLTSVSVNGRTVPIKTVSGVQPGTNPLTARHAATGVSAGTTVVQPGTKMEFRLAQPLSL
jgi:hypothetical protein